MKTKTDTYGICHLSVVPVRTEASDKAEIGTQLLFGDVFVILKTSDDGKWLYIQIAFDNYQGWIDFKQHKKISGTYYDEYLDSEQFIAKDINSYVSNEKKFYPILYGSIVPFFNNGIVDMGEERMQFKGELYGPPKPGNFGDIEKVARHYLGAPYLWGGKCHFGIDCSGFVQQVYKICGYKLPRDAWQQGECGLISDYGSAQPGDLAFFNNPQGKIVHVGIVLENSTIIHASGEVRIDRLEPGGIFNEEREIYSHRLYSIKRILG
jgi:hypothetical protein